MGAPRADDVRRLRVALLAATALVALVGVIAEVGHYTRGWDAQAVGLFSLSAEGNLPTWFSSALLLAGALATAAHARTVWNARARWRWHWALLAAGFGYLSLDETAQLHEHLNGLMPQNGALYFGWIVPAGAAVVVIAIAYLRFWVALPPATRWRFLVAGVLYVGGALGMEIPLGLWSRHHGEDNLGYFLIDAVEETLEMLGAALFLVAVQRHRARAEGAAEVAPGKAA